MNLNYLCLFIYFWSLVGSQTLHEQLQKSAGVYKDKKIDDLFKTVIVTTANYAYLNQLQNFMCFADRLQLKVLIVSMDEQAHAAVTSQSHYDSFLFNPGKKVRANNAPWRSAQFQVITGRKLLIVLNILQSGYNVLFSDPDVAILRDPMPYLLWDHVDYVHSMNVLCNDTQPWNFLTENEDLEGNTGFYFVRSNNRTISLFREAIKTMIDFPKLDDQPIFWKVARLFQQSDHMHNIGKCRDIDSQDPIILSAAQNDSTYGESGRHRRLISCALDACVFSSGMLVNPVGGRYGFMQHQLQRRNESMASVHANFMIGNDKKFAALRNHKLWLSSSKTFHNCLSYEAMSSSEYSNASFTLV